MGSVGVRPVRAVLIRSHTVLLPVLFGYCVSVTLPGVNPFLFLFYSCASMHKGSTIYSSGTVLFDHLSAQIVSAIVCTRVK